MFRQRRLQGVLMVAAMAAVMFVSTEKAEACGRGIRTARSCASPCERVRLLPGYFISETQRLCLSPGYWRTITTPPVTRIGYDICGRPYTQTVAPGRCRREWVPPYYEDRVIRKWVAPRWDRVRLGPQCSPTPYQGAAVAPDPLKQRAPRPILGPTPRPSFKPLAPVLAPTTVPGCSKCGQPHKRCNHCSKNPGLHQPGPSPSAPGNRGGDPGGDPGVPPAEPASYAPALPTATSVSMRVQPEVAPKTWTAG